ncbi:4-amino-4-deoxychorismate lyase [Microbacterium barkeri]|uniref:4-amino-4-deoxychorismate lyase n=1 Tax=Microbacterium barkeri TaxID=33917 RepID=A0A9W6LXA7_9MICO|nr:aminotransferase class IV [Microbacterium barkeri]MDR6877243.1 4-amino-4-deoxychorismate lyase [Microbacterium barkeri]GLJ62664.1 4-amino-4-deoxychorismate lyase [Microbacterium barkeri]
MSDFGVFFGRADQLLDTSFAGEPDIRAIDPAAASVSAFDLGLLRGDGVFEATTIVDDVPLAWHLHVRRLLQSAAALDLPTPNVRALDLFVRAAIRRMSPIARAHVKLVITRGVDATLSAVDVPTSPTVFAIIDPGFAPKKPEIEVATLERELLRDSAQRAPWLLLGAKTLSYATNMAARREYERRGAQNGVYVTRDGFVLEGPQSSIVLREGARVVTPHPRIGILHGTTQVELFAWASLNGLEVAYEDVEVERLHAADQVWMMGASFVQSVTAIDGRAIAHDRAATDAINAFMQTERAAIDAWTRAHVPG